MQLLHYIGEISYYTSNSAGKKISLIILQNIFPAYFYNQCPNCFFLIQAVIAINSMGYISKTKLARIENPLHSTLEVLLV